MARPVVDLPQPDSPTRPSVSPSSTSKLTSDTAWTLRPPPGGELDDEVLDRSRTSSVGSRRWAVPLPAIRHHLDRATDGSSVGADVGSPACRLRSQRGLALGRADREPAGELVAGDVGVAQRRLLLEAALLRVRAARREPAARGRVDEVGGAR